MTTEERIALLSKKMAEQGGNFNYDPKEGCVRITSGPESEFPDDHTYVRFNKLIEKWDSHDVVLSELLENIDKKHDNFFHFTKVSILQALLDNDIF